MSVPPARRTPEWLEQWQLFEDSERFLFEEWIKPATLEDLRGKDVLEAGCGGGQHTGWIAQVARSVTAVDLNTAGLARERNQGLANVQFVDGDIAAIDLQRQFDAVLCVGVIHHTDDPDQAFANLYRHLRPGGLMIIWTYSAAGNEAVRWFVEPARKRFFRHLSRRALVNVSRVTTAAMYPVVHTVYRVPFLSFLPYYEYFGNFRRMSFNRNMLNVFDKLNAPQTRFTTEAKCREWFSPDRFVAGTISICPYKGVSYSLNGVRV